METTIFNGIICVHDIPVNDSYEMNYGVVFLHNVTEPLGLAVIRLTDSQFQKIACQYFISDKQKDETAHISDLVKHLLGSADVEISSSGYPYSDVTPDICWSHKNQFIIGGHDMTKQLTEHAGKWLFMRIQEAENYTPAA